MFDPVFEEAIETVLSNEGGLSDHFADRGGRTKYGISKAAHPDVDIDSLTVEDAKKIYYEKYWIPLKPWITMIPTVVAVKLFDTAIWHGPHSAVSMLQRAVWAHGYKIDDDGVLGPITHAYMSSIGDKVLPAYRSEIAGRCRVIVASNLTQRHFIKGWLRRAYQ